MDLRLRNFPLVFTLAFVTPAFGQAVVPTVGRPLAEAKAPNPSRTSRGSGCIRFLGSSR